MKLPRVNENYLIIDSPPQSKMSRIEKKDLLDKAIAFMGESDISRNVEDECDIFGKYIASELRNVKDVNVQRWLKWSIQNTLYTGQCRIQMQRNVSNPSSTGGSSLCMVQT